MLEALKRVLGPSNQLCVLCTGELALTTFIIISHDAPLFLFRNEDSALDLPHRASTSSP